MVSSRSGTAVRDLRKIQILVYGVIEAGKSSMVLAASKFFSGWKTKKHTGALTNCSDMYWVRIDSDADGPFRDHGYLVPGFDVPALIADETEWRKAKFTAAPTYTQAVCYAIKEGRKSGARFLVLDDVTTLSEKIEAYRKATFEGDDKQQMYGLVRDDLRTVLNAASLSNMHVVYIAHAQGEQLRDSDTGGRRRADLMKTATGGEITPRIIGGAKHLFKAQVSLILALKTKTETKNGVKQVTRFVETAPSSGYETKSRYKLSLNPIEDADLGVILRKIQLDS